MFNPYNDNMLASVSNDGGVKVWNVPDGGLPASTGECQNFAGHTKIANLVKWHPTANNTFSTTGADNKMKTWDVITG